MKSCAIRSFSSSIVSTIKHQNPFMFPGQGTQFIGMPKTLAASDGVVVRNMFQNASSVLGYDLLAVCQTGPESRLNSTAVAQIAIFVSSMSALEVLRLESPAVVESCSAAMGLSLGEYTALCFAGCFSFEDGVRLVKERGECMQRAANLEPSGMVAINGLSVPDLKSICTKIKSETGEDIYIGNYLGEKMSALSGSKAACDAAIRMALEKGSKTALSLPVAGAFHSRFMDSASKPLTDVLSSIKFNAPRIAVYANYDGSVHTSADRTKELLVKQLNNPVQWHKIMNSVLTCASFNKQLYEIGPGNVCKGIAKIINRRVEVTSRE